MFPASRSGKMRTFARPATGLPDALLAATVATRAASTCSCPPTLRARRGPAARQEAGEAGGGHPQPRPRQGGGGLPRGLVGAEAAMRAPLDVGRERGLAPAPLRGNGFDGHARQVDARLARLR